MKKIMYFILPVALVACGGEESTEETVEEEIEETVEEVSDLVEEKKEERKSPRTQIDDDINGVGVHFDYGSPRVRKRKIWGDLVPYGEVWRAGADEVSAVTFDAAVMINGQEVPAGTYGMFVIPEASGAWTFILNEEWSKEMHDVWGAYDYKEDKDVLRFEVEPEWIEESVENLYYGVEGEHLIFGWEKAKLKIEVEGIGA